MVIPQLGNIDVRFKFYQESSDMVSRQSVDWEQILLLSTFEDWMHRMSSKAVLVICR